MTEAARETPAECDTERPTPKAVQACAEWLASCLQLGWRKDELDALEAVWWWYHDNCGRLKPFEPSPSPQTSPEALARLRQLGADTQRGPVPNLAEQIWDEADKLAETLATLQAERDEARSLLDKSGFGNFWGRATAREIEKRKAAEARLTEVERERDAARAGTDAYVGALLEAEAEALRYREALADVLSHFPSVELIDQLNDDKRTGIRHCTPDSRNIRQRDVLRWWAALSPQPAQKKDDDR